MVLNLVAHDWSIDKVKYTDNTVSNLNVFVTVILIVFLGQGYKLICSLGNMLSSTFSKVSSALCERQVLVI